MTVMIVMVLRSSAVGIMKVEIIVMVIDVAAVILGIIVIKIQDGSKISKINLQLITTPVTSSQKRKL
jgi:hypothetical protein